MKKANLADVPELHSRMHFTNELIDIERIPSVEQIELKGLDQNYLTVELIANSIFWFVIGSGALVLIFFNSWRLPVWASGLLYAILFLMVLTSFAVTVFGFRKKKYALREKDIIYQSGLLWRTYTVLPFNRVQHAEVQQGPVDRLFELSKLKIYTAGGSSSDMTIAGLPLKNAQNIKYFILNQTSGDEEE